MRLKSKVEKGKLKFSPSSATIVAAVISGLAALAVAVISLPPKSKGDLLPTPPPTEQSALEQPFSQPGSPMDRTPDPLAFDWVKFAITLAFPNGLDATGYRHACFDALLRNVSSRNVPWRLEMTGLFGSVDKKAFVYDPDLEVTEVELTSVEKGSAIVGYEATVEKNLVPGGKLRYQAYEKSEISPQGRETFSAEHPIAKRATWEVHFPGGLCVFPTNSNIRAKSKKVMQGEAKVFEDPNPSFYAKLDLVWFPCDKRAKPASQERTEPNEQGANGEYAPVSPLEGNVQHTAYLPLEANSRWEHRFRLAFAYVIRRSLLSIT